MKRARQRPTWRIVTLAAFVALVGMPLMIWEQWQGLAEQRASALWPVTNGRVTVSGTAFSTVSWSFSKLRLRYSYQVGGRAYTGTRFDAIQKRPESAGAIARAHPAGAAVTVAYDPRDPHRSVLRVGLRRMDVLLGAAVMGLYATVFLAGVAAVARFVRGSRNQPNGPVHSPAGRTMQTGSTK